MTPIPEDFIKNYSPSREAELLLWPVDERPQPTVETGLERFRRALRRWRLHPNEREARRARRAIEKKGAAIDAASVARYFTEKFAGKDHLRLFEYAFLARCLGRPEPAFRRIVDMGGGNSFSTVTLILLRRPEQEILSIDVVGHSGRSGRGIRYVLGDCSHTSLPDGSTDAVTIISTLEHVGLGRWGDPPAPDGDLVAMAEARRILRPGGHAIVTVPYGYPTVVFNLHRIYDAGRIARMTEGFVTVLAEYSHNGQACPRETAEGQKAVHTVPGYYDTPFPNTPAGILLLLRKR